LCVLGYRDEDQNDGSQVPRGEAETATKT